MNGQHDVEVGRPQQPLLMDGCPSLPPLGSQMETFFHHSKF